MNEIPEYYAILFHAAGRSDSGVGRTELWGWRSRFAIDGEQGRRKISFVAKDE